MRKQPGGEVVLLFVALGSLQMPGQSPGNLFYSTIRGNDLAGLGGVR